MSVEPETTSVEVSKTEEVSVDSTKASDVTKTGEVIDVEKLQAEFQESAKKYLVEQTVHVIIPSFAKWFDLNKIHPIEKKSFPDFSKKIRLFTGHQPVISTSEILS